MKVKDIANMEGGAAIDWIETNQEKLIINNIDFGDWWFSVGSGITPNPNEDKEEHAEIVCKALFDILTKDSQ